MKALILCMLVLLLTSCKKEEKLVITNPAHYNTFLDTSNNESLKSAISEKDYWNNRLKPDTSGVGEIGPLAGAYTRIFEASGAVENLKKAEALYKKGMEISANNKDNYARGLARTNISQHRFKEAKAVLEESYAGVSNKRATEMMLFDIYMELGDYDKADAFLGKIKNTNDYNYLIRLAKWSDYKGDLEAAIKYMEQAKSIAESRGSIALKVWTYSNLADFYGHAGRIEASYQHYLKTLQLQPDNAYAKKGIAWIAYAAEKNTTEANRILDSVMVHHQVPDYFLLKAEMAEFNNQLSEAEVFIDSFVNNASETDYGDMYNAYLIEIYAESQPEKALTLATQEIQNRATPETYSLLAYAQLMAGMNAEALQTIENFVAGKTFEPMAQYYSALVYKANGKSDMVKPLKKELLTAAFELGPVLTEKIEKL